MRRKVNELNGRALHWAVEKCEGVLCDYAYSGRLNDYSCWGHGGPIIEREGIWLKKWEGRWEAMSGWFPRNVVCEDASPLVAALRCYVTSKLGEEIDIPEDLA